MAGNSSSPPLNIRMMKVKIIIINTLRTAAYVSILFFSFFPLKSLDILDKHKVFPGKDNKFFSVILDDNTAFNKFSLILVINCVSSLMWSAYLIQ